jgi:hypothetical protein
MTNLLGGFFERCLNNFTIGFKGWDRGRFKYKDENGVSR